MVERRLGLLAPILDFLTNAIISAFGFSKLAVGSVAFSFQLGGIIGMALS